jgi:UDP-N-acetylglucosamine acyltransferase
VTLNRGTEGGGGVTRIGDGNLLMAYVHVAHDCTIGSGCVLANAATLAGHITIGDRAIIGGLVGIHQFVRVGELAFIGGMTAVRQDVPPYTLCMGDPMRLTGLNLEGLKRARFPAETVSALKEAYRVLVRSGATTPEAAARVRRDVADLPEVRRLVEFFETSKRGIPRKAAKE